MANSVTTQILMDGPRNVVVKFEGVLDTSDLGTTTVIDVSALTVMQPGFPGAQPPSSVSIQEVQYNVEDGMSVNLFWDATTDLRIMEYTGRGKECYKSFGGLINNAGTGVTGDVLATTEGWGSGIKSFSLIIWCKKHGSPA